MKPSFCNSLHLILFNCPNSLRNTICFFKILLHQLGCLFPVSCLLLKPTIFFVSVIVSVFMRDTILLIFAVAALTFFLSMYLRMGGIFSGSHLISFTILLNSSFSSSLHLFISAFLTNISSLYGNKLMRYVSCCCLLTCPCSTKTSCALCSSN